MCSIMSSCSWNLGRSEGDWGSFWTSRGSHGICFCSAGQRKASLFWRSITSSRQCARTTNCCFWESKYWWNFFWDNSWSNSEDSSWNEWTKCSCQITLGQAGSSVRNDSLQTSAFSASEPKSLAFENFMHFCVILCKCFCFCSGCFVLLCLWNLVSIKSWCFLILFCLCIFYRWQRGRNVIDFDIPMVVN